MSDVPIVGRFRAVILCEDIRREDNGKHFVAGIFANNVEYPAFPANSYFRLYVEFFELELRERSLDFQWKVNGELIVGVKGSVEMTEPGIVPISLPPVMLNFEAPGKLTVDVIIDEEKPATILERNVVVQPAVREQTTASDA
jgi:hypothetical protein